jgi:phosphoribosylaminoimidazolecarboxamide formyltransferase / IMP cyclohydrolase
MNRPIKRALISVSDKTGVVEFCEKLAEFGVEIISTGGTAKLLRENNLAVKEVSDVTEFPEMLDGRVKTLHPKIHGGILGIRDNENHLSQMNAHNIEPIDLVVIDLYPFEKTIANPDVTFAEAIENIDIGGPAMIRSSAKNWESVAVIVNRLQYDVLLKQMAENAGATTAELRQTLSVIAFMRTSTYDGLIAKYLQNEVNLAEVSEDVSEMAMKTTLDFMPQDEFDEYVDDIFNSDDNDEDDDILNEDELTDEEKVDDETVFIEEPEVPLLKRNNLRYGENPHQKAAVYESMYDIGGIAQGELLCGKEMSYNNYVDADAAWNLVNEFEQPACAIIKHTNPCGVGVSLKLEEAYLRALATDRVSAFGGIVAFNRKVSEKAALAVIEVFTEVVVAPEFSDEALEIFKSKKNLRVLQVDPLELEFEDEEEVENIEYRAISGGYLAQTKDEYEVSEFDLKAVSNRQPTDDEVRAMLFAWKVCKHTKSNAIVLTNDVQTIGVGAGQMNRVDSVRIAGLRAERSGLDLSNIVLASDAFFPFRDGVDECAKLGMTAIIQPGGSIRDDEVIQAANEHNLAMVFTGFRHFWH